MHYCVHFPDTISDLSTPEYNETYLPAGKSLKQQENCI